MATYVLVHGAWHGAGAGDSCRTGFGGPAIRSSPHADRAGERAQLLTPDIGLQTHVDDIAGLLRSEDLRNVVLVGHSYAGFVVREVADRMPERVARLVMVDAWAGRDGESLRDRAPEFFLNWIDSVTEDGVIPVAPPATVGVVEPDQVAWLESSLTPHPHRTFSDPTRLSGAVDAIPCRAVLCTPNGPMPFPQLAKEFGWDTTELDVGHDAMVTAPEALTEILLKDA